MATSRPGFTFCVCPDGHLIRTHIHTLLAQQAQTWKVRTFWADEELPDAYWQAMTWTGLLGQPTAVVLRRVENLKAEHWKKLHPILGRFQEKIWPFFCLEKEWAKGKPQIPAVLSKQAFWKVAEKRGWIWQTPGLDRGAVQDRFRVWAQKQGVQVPDQVFTLVVQALPLDAAALDNELAKLELLLADRKTMTAEDLGVLSFQADLDIFAFIRALQSRGQELQVWRTLFRNQLGSNADMVMPFLALLLREVRILWQLQAGEGNKVWMPGPVKQEKTRMANRLGANRLARIWGVILEAETGIKSGDVSPAQASELVISRLMQIFA